MPSILKPLATDTNRSEKNIQFTMQSNAMLLLVSNFQENIQAMFSIHSTFISAWFAGFQLRYLTSVPHCQGTSRAMLPRLRQMLLIHH